MNNEQHLNLEEKGYLNLISKILEKGEVRETRNAITKSLFGEKLEFDISNSIPFITTRRRLIINWELPCRPLPTSYPTRTVASWDMVDCMAIRVHLRLWRRSAGAQCVRSSTMTLMLSIATLSSLFNLLNPNIIPRCQRLRNTWITETYISSMS